MQQSSPSLLLLLSLQTRLLGAGGSTEQQLYHLLHQDKSRLLGLVQPQNASAEDVTRLLQQIGALAGSLTTQAGSGSELLVASSIWTNGWPIRPEYASAVKELFQVSCSVSGLARLGAVELCTRFAGIRITKTTRFLQKLLVFHVYVTHLHKWL